MSLELAQPKPQPDLLSPMRGPWLTRPRLTVLLLVSLTLMAAAWLRILWGSDGRVDAFGRLLGGDFAPFWGAGKAVLAGNPAGPYGLDWFNLHLKDVLGPGTPKFAWGYPPTVFFLVAPLAALPYGAALAIWLGATYAALVAAVRAILGKTARQPLFWLAVAAWPGVYGNGLQGQSGFLAAALFGGALLFVDRRPAVAGLLFALLAFKPQFGVLVPFALVAGRRWSAIAWAAGFGAALLALSIVAFGWDVWPAFVAGLEESRHNILGEGKAGFHIFQSPYGVLRHYGLAAPIAWIGQAAASVALAVLVWRIWAGDADMRLKSAALIAASLMATPYCVDYDLVVLAPAIAFCVGYGFDKGFGPWGHSILLLAFVTAPLARFSSFFLGFPLGLAAASLLFTFLLSEASRHQAASAA